MHSAAVRRVAVALQGLGVDETGQLNVVGSIAVQAAGAPIKPRNALFLGNWIGSHHFLECGRHLRLRGVLVDGELPLLAQRVGSGANAVLPFLVHGIEQLLVGVQQVGVLKVQGPQLQGAGVTLPHPLNPAIGDDDVPLFHAARKVAFARVEFDGDHVVLARGLLQEARALVVVRMTQHASNPPDVVHAIGERIGILVFLG